MAQTSTFCWKAFPQSVYPAIIRSALLLRGKQPKQCEELLEEAAAKAANPTAALLTLAQLQLQGKELEKALATLKRIEDLKRSVTISPPPFCLASPRLAAAALQGPPDHPLQPPFLPTPQRITSDFCRHRPSP